MRYKANSYQPSSCWAMIHCCLKQAASRLMWESVPLQRDICIYIIPIPAHFAIPESGGSCYVGHVLAPYHSKTSSSQPPPGCCGRKTSTLSRGSSSSRIQLMPCFRSLGKQHPMARHCQHNLETPCLGAEGELLFIMNKDGRFWPKVIISRLNS